MKKRDAQLGMRADIGRRDFIHDVGLAGLGLMLPAGALAEARFLPGAHSYYPPVENGLRGSHPGSFETAHALAREGRAFDAPHMLDEAYDLVVVGGGISGLVSAYEYRKRLGDDARILILENHDDFGGHARRNEFHQGGAMRLAWGGVFNLEYEGFSPAVSEWLTELGVDIDTLISRVDFKYGADGARGPATYFDAESYGRDVLIPGFAFRYGDFAAMAGLVDDVPLDAESVQSLRRFFAADTDVLAGRGADERDRYLSSISYFDFIQKHGGLTQEAAELFINTTHGYWGVGTDGLSVTECIDAGLPIMHLLGGGPGTRNRDIGGNVAQFPDGNASIARILVRALIPDVAPGQGAEDIVTARFDYARLDEPSSAVRLRLNATVVSARNEDNGVSVSYVKDGRVLGVRARHCVLACWHSIIPHLCRELPPPQKEALSRQVKRPLVLTNVLLRGSEAADRLGISGAHCPGRMHAYSWLIKGVEAPGYAHEWSDDGAVVMQFWGTVGPPMGEMDIMQWHRAQRAQLLSMSFEDFEREVRTVLNGMLGPAGFDAARDILAITVNRWPHGYAYDYLDLWDPDWPPGQAPHEVARQRRKNIVIANSDAGAGAYTHVAIEQALRAMDELVEMRT